MLYLLDANVLITAESTFYAIDQVPEFWDWILHQGEKGLTKIPLEIIEEIDVSSRKDDRLIEWIKKGDNRSVLQLKEEVNSKLVHKVIKDGYAEDLSDVEVDQLGRDPFLIAYAMAAMADKKRCVVTMEVSKPSRKRQNRKVPDVCASLSVQCCNIFKMTRDLNFSTSWNQD